MKTIVWKELREHAFWIPLGLIAMSIVTFLGVYNSPLLLDVTTVTTACVFAAAAIATLLGLLQSWFDVRLDSRALLLHRGITPSQAFFAKYLAGLMMHSLAVLPPLIVAALWLIIDDRHTFAAYWTELLPLMLYVLLAFVCWPAAHLTVQREARLFGSRLFALPCVYSVLAFGTGMSFDFPFGFIFGTIFIAVAFAFATESARSAFVSLGRPVGRARVFLAILHGVGLFIGTSALTMTIHESWTLTQRGSTYSYTTLSVELGQDGEPILTSYEYEQVLGRTEVEWQVAKMSPDHPVRELLETTSDPDALGVWHLLPNSLYTARLKKGPMVLIGTMRKPVIDNNLPPELWALVFDQRAGEVLVYDSDRSTSNTLTGRLHNRITPSMLTGALRFNQLNGMGAWNSIYSFGYGGQNRQEQQVVQLDDEVFVFHNDGKTVESFYKPPATESLVSTSARRTNGDTIIDHCYRLEDRCVIVTTEPLAGDAKELETRVAGSIYFESEIQLPKKLAAESNLKLAKIPDAEDEFAVLVSKVDHVYDWYRINSDGKVLNEKTYHEDTSVTPVQNIYPTDLLISALIPLVGWCVGATTIAVIYVMAPPESPVHDMSLFGDNTELLIWRSALATIQIVVAIGITYWVCRRRRLTKTMTRRWILAAIFLGPFLGIALLTVYPRIAMQPCPTCKKRSRVDEANCEHCNQPLDQPSRKGIEIFDDGVGSIPEPSSPLTTTQA